MPGARYDLVLKGGKVIDVDQNINRLADIAIKNGTIEAIGDGLESQASQVIDLEGMIVTPGLFDMHLHTYGFVSFSNPDSIGIYQGVTAFADAGGPGPLTFKEFKAVMQGRTVTDLYAHVFVNAGGVCDFDEGYGHLRSIGEVPLNDWLDIIEQDREIVRSLKIAAFGNLGTGCLKMEKGLAEILGLPVYAHTGDILVAKPKQITTPYLYQILEKGDIVTHFYNGNPGNIIGEDGRIIPEVYEAAKRGVLFDVGFGSFNFSFEVAEKALPEGFLPSIISSDLQQINVTGPVYSLANVMSMFLMLGLSLEEIIERVTIAPAKALGLAHKHGSLRPGRPADVTVLAIEEGDFEFADSAGGVRKGNRKFVPIMAFKRGQRYDSDMQMALDEHNWSLSVAEDHVPKRADSLDVEEKEFLVSLRRSLAEEKKWSGLELHRCFHHVQQVTEIPLRKALEALFKAFLDDPFTYQAGWLLASLPKPTVLGRLAQLSSTLPVAS